MVCRSCLDLALECVQLRGHIVPGHEECWSLVLVAVEDVTNLQTARQEITRSEAYACGLFEHSPVMVR